MALTPSSTIVASQSGSNRYDYSNTAQSTSFARGQTYNAIYRNGADQYVVLNNCTNISADPDNRIYFLSVFKRNGSSWTEIDFANRPSLRNWDTLSNPVSPIASCWDVAQIGTKLYIFYFNNVTSPVLSCKVFDMATDSFGAELNSTLSYKAGFTPVADYLNQFSGGPPELSVVYTSVTGRISIVGPIHTIQGTDTFSKIRPSIAQFDPVGPSWDANWTIMGHDNTVLQHEGAMSICTDCRGATNLIIAYCDFHGGTDTNLFFQSSYADRTIGPVVALGIAVAGTESPETDTRILSTGTEFILLYADGRDGSGFRTGLKNARATIPALDHTEPSSWTTETIHTAVSQEFLYAWVPFVVSGELLAFYIKINTPTPTTTLTCAKWNGSSWTDAATPSNTVVLAVNNGDIPDIRAHITYDFTAPVVVGTTLADEIGVGQAIFSFISYSQPICNVATEIDRTAADTLNLNDNASANGPAGLTGPGTGYVFEYETGVGRRATWEE